MSNEQRNLKLQAIGLMKQKHIYKKLEDIKNKMKKKNEKPFFNQLSYLKMKRISLKKKELKKRL